MSQAALKQAGETASLTGLKQQLVDCIRMLEQADIIDYNGHASIRLDDGRILINIGSCQRSRLTAGDICTIDLEANQIEGNGNAPLERHLHCGIYRARPDVTAIVHAHPKWSTYLTMVGASYQPVYAQGSLVYPVPLLDSPNSINNRAMADRLAATLGERPAAPMKSHGAVTVGKDI
ncbi:MAG: class II aldolase/adducin family protein, partial [Candidatus Rokubacteria bacterium]|nr:class II aldolase/adducin family protein [Candidatus Rokubacteria bacterium]